MKKNKKKCIGLSNCSFEQFKEGIDFLKQTDAILDDDIFPILKRVCSYLFFCVKHDNFEFVKSYDGGEGAGKAKGISEAQAGQGILEGQPAASAAGAMASCGNAPPTTENDTTLNYVFKDEDFIIVKNINRLLLNKLIENYVGYSWLCLTVTEYLNDLDYFMNKQGKNDKEGQKKEINARKKVYKLVKKFTQVKNIHELQNCQRGQVHEDGKKAIQKLEAKNKYINYLFCYYNNYFLSSNVTNGENAQGEDVIVLDHVDHAHQWIYTDDEDPSAGCSEKREKHVHREHQDNRVKRARTSSAESSPTKRNAHLKRRRKCYGVKDVDMDHGEGSYTNWDDPFHEQIEISPGKEDFVYYEGTCDISEEDQGRSGKRKRTREEKRQKRRLQRRLERRQKGKKAPREKNTLQHLYKALCDFLSTKYETSKLLKFMDEYRDMYAWKPPPFYWTVLSSKYVVKEILKLYEDRYLDPFLSCLYEDYVNKYYFDDEENSNIATYTSNFNVFTLRISEEIQRFLILEEPEEEEAVLKICKNICVSENSYIYAQMILEYMYRNNNDNSMRRLSQYLSLYILYKDINLHKICNNYFAQVVENQVSITFLTFRINNLNNYSTLYSTFRNIYMTRNKGCMEISQSDIVSLHDAIVSVLKIFNGNKLLLFDSTYLFSSHAGRNRLGGRATSESGDIYEGSTNLKRQISHSEEGEEHSFHFHHREEDTDFNSNFSNINRSNLEEACRRGDVLLTEHADDDASSSEPSLPSSPSETEEPAFEKGDDIYNPSEDIPATGENSFGANSLFGSSLDLGQKEKRNGADGGSAEMNDRQTNVSNRSSKNLSNEVYSSIKSEDFASNVHSENNEMHVNSGRSKNTASVLILPSASQYGNEDFNYHKEFLRINIYAEKIPLVHMRDIVFLNNAINIYVSNSELFFNNMYKLYGKVLIFLTTYSPYEYVYNHYYASLFKRRGHGSSRKYSAAYFSVYDDAVSALDGVEGDSDDEEVDEPYDQHEEQCEQQPRDDLCRAPEADAPSEVSLAPGLSAAGKFTGKRTYEQFFQVKKEPAEIKSILKRRSSYAGGGSEVRGGNRLTDFDKHVIGDAADEASAKEEAPVEQDNLTASESVERSTEVDLKTPPPNEAVQKGSDANVLSAGDPLPGTSEAEPTTHPVEEAPASDTFPPQRCDTHNYTSSNIADDMLELRTEVMSCDEVRSSIFKNVKSKKKLKINATSKKKKYYFYKLFHKFRLTYNTFLKYTQNEIYQIYQIMHGNYSDATKDKLLLARVNSNLAASLIYRYVYTKVYELVNTSRVNLVYPKFILLKYIVDMYPQKRHLALHFLKELYTYIIEKEESLEEFVELRENLILFFVYLVRFENMFCYVVSVIKSMVNLLDKAFIRLFIIKTLTFCAPPYDFKFCECLLNFIHFVLNKEGVYYKNEFKRAIHKLLDNVMEMHQMYQSSKTKELAILCTHIKEQIKQAEMDPTVR
ncbi:hypothetical protein AK88_01965 [Plasmodium fragile]|uniref:Uncharacterized protein n=1 Tax=Plasmodium fragile TaxID=5857 RepID=A0A0D9QMS8_PLAFR|nr:uncharacterized protein AK88_01965 [Plasmodium fragile]KJP88349.1 hypothetical protein AK88_01965 [Plasmodium fragile]